MGDLRETDHLEVLGVDGMVILKRILQDVGWEYDLAQDRDKWWPVVSAEMNLRVS